MTTKSGKKVTIRVKATGVNFGCFAEVRHNGKRLTETRIFPRGFEAEARKAAQSLLEMF